ncbi:FAD-dependent monooxygenase [Sphingobium sp. HWE2-09]|uniref:FAD-dependent monooxygenase n=1 Tax=Sphingobium sp. HWE2-09 TaxID=3108390 RepID=UPI002DC92591|nr:FAD-dependent monooxygenase [Sphingobium sp. HWE2-09]
MSSELSRLSILVSGAGAAGQTVSYWLARHGARVTLLERASAPRIGGFAIDLRGVAVTVADRMGILEQARAARVRTREIVRIAPDGSAVWKTDGNFGAGEGVSGDVEILRDDLTSILASAQAQVDGVENLFNDSIATLVQDEDGVDVTFASGKSAKYDLVIGADGLHSNVRALAFGPEEKFARPRRQYCAIFTLPNILNMERQWLMLNLPGKSVSVIQYGADKHTRSMFIFASPPIDFDRRDTVEQKRILKEVFEPDNDKWVIRQILDELEPANDLYFDDVTQIHMESWSNGRVALVGDAGYAPTLMTGQGSSLAVVGGYVLAGELKRAGGDHRVAFPEYRRVLRDYVAANQALINSPEFDIIADSWEEIHARDRRIKEILDSAGDTPAAERGDDGSTGAELVKAANAVELPHY